MRYQISKHIQFLHPEECSTIQLDTFVLQNRILIRDTKDDRSFLVNPTIETFIKKFTVAKTLDEITAEIAAEVHTPVIDVKKIILPFFNHSKYRHFIVSENYTEKEPSAVASFAINTILDEYKIEKIIDVNSNIDVYMATDLNSANTVVIKLLKRPNEQAVEALKREYNFLETLSKTGVTPLAYTFIERDKYTYFTQQFVDGLSLPQFIKRKKNTPKKLVLDIAAEIIEAFEKIHAENIVHGDIHPSNIILTNKMQIKVLDFGLAIHHELEKDELINFGGAYFFMPPERIKKTTYKKFTRKPDFSSDVFQLGVVLYTFLYDAYPFNGITWEELATAIKEKPIEFPPKSQYGFLVPEWLKNSIAMCVAKKPSARFANAHELYNAISKKRMDNASKIRSAIKI
ncbi:serine/threonine protein kinase [Ilyomonas limi]|uniref:Serine/threonine protein kinase n=1 Tax=Ilyomonas limi TaxID=2575867 RepID=A0A4U3L9B3_9BACT|nr:serine/threonine-protein kinase [Ilyomonas limi]TKK71888.1 serine/threonine protein kinase [Ilyomonas limi]